MNFRNTKVILLILILGCESKLFLRFNSVKCGASLKSASDIYCYVKTYARKLSILNVGYTLLRRISEGLLTLTVEHKFKNDAYRMILNYTDYPICETFHSGKGNFFIQTFINTTQQIAGEVVESCERSGDFRVWNMSFMNTTMLSLWPAGSYRVAYKFTDGIDSNIVNLTFEGICLR